VVNQSLHYGELRIPYKVFFVLEKAHKLAIHVHPDGSVQVDAPSDTPLDEIKQAVARRAYWLSRHLKRINEQKAHVLPREYISGESHFYLGRRYLLKVRQSLTDTPSVKLRQGRFEIITGNIDCDAVRTMLWEWYKAHARNLFDQRLELVWPELAWVKEKPRWRLLTMKKQWGSCSPNGVLSLNPHLVKASTVCVDYVLLHELCHLKFHNHSKSFYRLLNKQMPEWEALKGRLDGMAELLLNA